EVGPAPSGDRLKARLGGVTAGELFAVVGRLGRLFDVDVDAAAVVDALGRDARLGAAVRARPGLRVPGAWDGFETAVRAILGQQITVKGATRLASRIVATLGRGVAEATDDSALTHAFPHPNRFKADVLAR